MHIRIGARDVEFDAVEAARVFRREAQRDGFVVANQHRRNRHAENDGGDDRLAQVETQQAGSNGDCQQRKTELAALAEQNPGANRDPPAVARDGGDQGNRKPLAGDQPEGHNRYFERFIEDDMPVELRSHGNEKQPQENVAKRANFILDVMLILGFGEHNARQEGTHRQR